MPDVSVPSPNAPETTPKPEVVDDFVTRSHRTASGLRYTSTTGRMVLRKEEDTEGKTEGFNAKAEIFLVAYTAETEEAPATGNGTKSRAKKPSGPTAAPARPASGCTWACWARASSIPGTWET